MSFRTKYLDDAKLDVREITQYLAQFYKSTARNFKTQLIRQVRMLRDTPYMCQAYEEDPFFRRMVVDDYNLFYSVDETQRLVVIHRVLHHSRDASRYLLSGRM